MMSTTPQILRLVREGRVSPHGAAMLLELRGRVAQRRGRVRFLERLVRFLGIPVVAFRMWLAGTPKPLRRGPH